MHSISRLASAFILMAGPASADQVSIPHSFSANTPAVAAEVNDNFNAVAGGVNDNDNRIAALEAAVASLQGTVNSQASTIASLQSQLAAVQGSNVMALDPYLSLVDVADPVTPSVTYPTARFAGLNVQIVNGTGSTDGVPNGLGNLIIGYDEANGGFGAFCSSGQYDNQGDCESAGFTWDYNQRSGSHYLIVGEDNSYSQYGGLIVGMLNVGNGKFASVSGGAFNMASGDYASVSGGGANTATGFRASVTGGESNRAGGSEASVNGGYSNSAMADQASIAGGSHNGATGLAASVVGGDLNIANGNYSSIGGGYGIQGTSQYGWCGGETNGSPNCH